MRKKAYASILVLLTTFTFAVLVAVPPAKAQFVIATWTYPDAYGQGLEGIEVFENSTGSWVYAPNPYSVIAYDEEANIPWDNGVAIKLGCWSWLNSTLTGAVDEADGKNYQRHSVDVTLLGVSVFSQQNFTYYSSDDTLDVFLWFYEYYVILDFLPVQGGVYTVTITYEIFW